MGLRALVEKWEDEFRTFYGTDSRTDRSMVGPGYLTESENLIIEQGVLKTRLGSSQWGSLDVTSIAGTTYKIMTIDVGTADYVLMHRATGVYYGLKGSGSMTQIADIAGGNLAVTNAESEMEAYGYTVGSAGNRVVKILFKQTNGCKILEFNEATGVWTGRNAGINNGSFTFVASQLVGGGTNQAVGTYRVRLVARRVVNTVVTNESAPTGKNTSTSDDKGYQEVVLTVNTNRLQLVVTYSGIDAQITHWQAQVTRVLNFPSGSVYSDNGNDPTLYFETTNVVLSGSPQTIILDVSPAVLEVPVPDLIGYDPIPGHLVSVYAGGILFFGGITPYYSRIYYSGLSGYYYHNELYNPLQWIPADEGDGQLLTDLELCGDHLYISKEGKTGILPNKNVDSPIVWRDKRIGSLTRNAAANISEDQLVVLCQDGILRIFDGVQFTARQQIDGNDFDFSEAIRPITEAIDPTTVTYIWHKERLHMLYGASGFRKALVLHPREKYAWMPWTGLQHEWNGLVANGNSWIFLYNSHFYEQNVTDVYQDFAATAITWKAVFSVLHPHNRRNKVWMQRCLVEGYFQYIFNAIFKTDGGYITTTAVDAVPNPELTEFAYNQWFALYPTEQVYGNFIELTLNGSGKFIGRAVHWIVIEKDTGSGGWTYKSDYERYFWVPQWATGVVLHLTFDVNSDTAKDYSGNRHDHTYAAGSGGSRTFESAQIPGGGQSLLTGGTGSGYSDATWDGLDYIGDYNSGQNSASLTYEYINTFPTLASTVIIHEAGDGNRYWRLLVNTDGSLEYQILTTGANALSYKFTTVAGIISAGSTQYTIQFVLSNSGLNGQFYAAPRTSAFAALTTTRAALV